LKEKGDKLKDSGWRQMKKKPEILLSGFCTLKRDWIKFPPHWLLKWVWYSTKVSPPFFPEGEHVPM
jgi:hypothetical protein